MSQRPEFVQDSYDRYEGLNEQNNFVYASIASQKYLFLPIPVNYGMLPQANATRRLFPALSKRKSPDTSFEGENEDYSVRTKTGTSLRSNRRAPKPFSRIVS